MARNCILFGEPLILLNRWSIIYYLHNCWMLRGDRIGTTAIACPYYVFFCWDVSSSVPGQYYSSCACVIRTDSVSKFRNWLIREPISIQLMLGHVISFQYGVSMVNSIRYRQSTTHFSFKCVHKDRRHFFFKLMNLLTKLSIFWMWLSILFAFWFYVFMIFEFWDIYVWEWVSRNLLLFKNTF